MEGFFIDKSKSDDVQRASIATAPSYDRCDYALGWYQHVVRLASDTRTSSKQCFNCGSSEHEVKDCPEVLVVPHESFLFLLFMAPFLQPHDQAQINKAAAKARKERTKKPAGRYHAKAGQKRDFGHFRPGVLSAELRRALDIFSRSFLFATLIC